jgi:hypothetical protein
MPARKSVKCQSGRVPDPFCFLDVFNTPGYSGSRIVHFEGWWGCRGVRIRRAEGLRARNGFRMRGRVGRRRRRGGNCVVVDSREDLLPFIAWHAVINGLCPHLDLLLHEKMECTD